MVEPEPVGPLVSAVLFLNHWQLVSPVAATVVTKWAVMPG